METEQERLRECSRTCAERTMREKVEKSTISLGSMRPLVSSLSPSSSASRESGVAGKPNLTRRMTAGEGCH